MIHAHELSVGPLGLFLYDPSLAFAGMKMGSPDALRILLDLEI